MSLSDGLSHPHPHHSTIFGSPNPSNLQLAAVAPSGGGIALVAQDALGNLANLTSIAAGSEIQTLLMPGTVNGGTFTLAVPGTSPPQVTGAIPYNATAQQIQDALALLPFLSSDGVHPTAPTPAPSVVDDSSSGFSVAGSKWTTASGSYYGGSTHVSSDPAAVATWVLPTHVGSFSCALTWTSGTNRAATATWTVKDGSTVLGTGTINQKVAPNADVTSSSISFQMLGTFISTSGTVTLSLANTSGGSSFVADAAYVASIADTPALIVALSTTNSRLFTITYQNRLRDTAMPLLAADGTNLSFSTPLRVVVPTGPGYSETVPNANALTVTKAGYANTTRYSGTAGFSATWQVDGLAPGSYIPEMDWVSGTFYASSVTYQVYDGTTLLNSVTVNQETAPVGDSEGTLLFQPLGTFSIQSGTIKVVLAKYSGGSALADAMRLCLPSGGGSLPTAANTPEIWSSTPGNGSVPSIQINGGTPISLHNLYWGKTTKWSPFAYYALPDGTSVQATDSVTITAPAGYATTTSGPMPALAAYPLTNLTQTPGGPARTLLPAFDTTKPRTMRVGYNFSSLYLSTLIPFYDNLMQMTSSGWYGSPPTDAQGYLPSMTDTTVLMSVRSCGGDGFSPSHFEKPGHYTLMWDGPAAELYSLRDYNVPAGTGTYTLISQTITGTTDNTRIYDIQPIAPNTSANIVLCLTNPNSDGSAYVPQARNIRVYGPDSAGDGRLFHPGLIKLIGSANQIARWMTPLGINASNMTRLSQAQRVPGHFACKTGKSYPGTIIGADPYAGTGFLDTGAAQVVFTCSAPHVIESGVYLTVTLASPITLADGTTVPSGAQIVNSVVEKVSQTQFAIRLATPAKTYTAAVVAGQTITASYSYSTGTSLPFEDMVECCNVLGADFWLNVPAVAPVQWTIDAITYLLAHLKPGLRVYLEYTNEWWNSGFNQNYLMGYLGRSNGQNMGVYQAYAYYASLHHAAAAQLFQAAGKTVGRTGDLVRVLGTQGPSPTTTQTLVQKAKGYGIAFDALAVAPYMDNNPASLVSAGETTFGPMTDTWNTEQRMDLCELNMEYGGWEQWVTSHRAILDSYGYTSDITDVVGYEGGPQHGIPAGGERGTTASLSRDYQWHRHPRLRGVLLRVMDKWEAAGMTAFNLFELSSGFGEGTWSAWVGHEQVAGPGDGSDGGFDNRSNFEALDKIESVVGGALTQWGSMVVPRAVVNPVTPTNIARPHHIPHIPFPPTRLFGKLLSTRTHPKR